jgi:hypothetical protein
MGLTLTQLANSNDEVPDGDYEVILLTIEKTARGRAFLAEYARRIHRSDVQMILTEIDKLKSNQNDDRFDFTGLR